MIWALLSGSPAQHRRLMGPGLTAMTGRDAPDHDSADRCRGVDFPSRAV